MFRSAVTKAFLSAVALVGGCDTTTLTGAVTLTGRSGRVQRLDPGGATRTVDLPGPSEGIPDTDGHWFIVQNTADAAENLTIRDPANATVGTLTKGQTGLFWGTGTTYVQVFAAGGPTGSTAAGEGASLVGIQDVGTYYTGTEVEAALQELGLSRAALALTTNGNGASLIGIEDAGTNFTGANVEAALTEAMDAAQAAQAEVDTYQDQFVTATIAVEDGPGGDNSLLLTLQLKRAQDHSTNIASARQVLICSKVTTGHQYAPADIDWGSDGVSYGTATTGSIVASNAAASGEGWALVETDATGAFACTVTNVQDAATWYIAKTADGVSDLAKRCVVVGSNSDLSTTSA